MLKDSVDQNCNVGFSNGVFWNTHGACIKVDNVELLARNENVDIICIAEPCLSSGEFLLFDIPTLLKFSYLLK